MIALRNPFYSVLALIVHLISLAGLFLLLQGEFLAAAQVVVYAGAVMVLYVFVAAYVGNVEEPLWEPIPGQRFIAPMLGIALFVELSIAVARLRPARRSTPRARRSSSASAPRGDRQAAAGALPDRLRGGIPAAADRGRGRRRPAPAAPPARRGRARPARQPD